MKNFRREPPAHELHLIRKTLIDIFHCNTTSHPIQMRLHKFLQLFAGHMVKIMPYAHCLEKHGMRYGFVEDCRLFIREICGNRFTPSGREASICLQRLWFNRTLQNPTLEANFTKYENCLSNVSRHLPVCSAMPDKVCATTKVRAIKTVRTTMKSIRPFFKDVPNFRVIHLIRDPRAAVASKMGVPWSQGIYASTDVRKEARIYCQQVSLDLAWRMQIEEEYPGQIIELVYDDFVQRPEESLGRLYNFLELDIHNVTRKRMLKATKDSTAKAKKWQLQLTWAEVKSIEEQCKDVFQNVAFKWPT